MNITLDNQMQRGIVQSIFNYLPLSHIDFHIRSTRNNYSARVRYWKTKPLLGINTIRVLNTVKENIESFVESGGQIKNFSSDFSETTYKILTPITSEDGAIFASIDPLTFFCQSCMRSYTFPSKHAYEGKEGIERECCKHNLKQIMFAFPCECGYCGSIKTIRCPKHLDSDVLYDTNNYTFICAECAGRIDMKMKCPDCGKILFPHAALDRSNLIAANHTLIDLLNSKEEHFLSSVEYGNKVIVAKWLNKLADENYYRIISGKEAEQYEKELNEYAQKVEEYKSIGLNAETAENFAKADLYADNQKSIISQVAGYTGTALNITEPARLNKSGSQILEYYRVLKSANVFTLDEAKKIASTLTASYNPNECDNLLGKMGLSNCIYSGDIPFLLISYGFTRKRDNPGEGSESHPLTLRAFCNKKSENMLYGVKIATEGIMFELDKRKIVEWLINNNIVKEFEAPDLDNDNDLKRWFINNINMLALNKFSNIKADEHPVTANVYKLIHSISHALIRKTSICGLDSSSIGEYLLPNIPAFIIYCKNTGGISIGAIASLFKVHFTSWLANTYDDIGNCISDPICIERDKACNGCLLLPNTSCEHQNKDLDRSLLYGYKDNEGHLIGFWE